VLTLPLCKDNKNYCVAGIDLGGTKIYTAVADNNGNLLAETRAPTCPEEGYRRVIERMAGTVLEVQKRAGVRAIRTVGVGSPGQLDLEKGIVCTSGNLGWNNVYLRDLLAEKLSLPVILDNDANVAALGEYVFGAGRGHREMVYITVSTGIGSGIISGGRLIHGVKGCAGEIGHLTVAPGGPLCTCGKHGCLEAFSSGTAIALEAEKLIREGRGSAIKKQAQSRKAKVAAEDVGAAAAHGDGEALGILCRAASALGLGVSIVINLLNPSLVILGGGVMSMSGLIWDDILEAVNEYTLKANLSVVQVVPAGLGERAGVLGAVALALQLYPVAPHNGRFAL